MSKEAMKLALEALEGIHRYGLDTLSGRSDGPDDRDWQRAGVNEMTKRARLSITAIREALAEQPAQKCSYPYCGCNSKAWCKVERNEALDKMAENAKELGLDYEPAQQEPEYIQLRHKEEDGFSPWGQPLDPKYRHDKWAAGVEMRLLYTSPQPAQQEPVAWMTKTRSVWKNKADETDTPLYTSPPPQRTWVGLTDEERKLVRNSVGYNQFVTAGEYAEHVQKATEFKLREKNT